MFDYVGVYNRRQPREYPQNRHGDRRTGLLSQGRIQREILAHQVTSLM